MEELLLVLIQLEKIGAVMVSAINAVNLVASTIRKAQEEHRGLTPDETEKIKQARIESENALKAAIEEQGGTV